MRLWTKLIPGIAFAALLVVGFAASYAIAIPVYVEGDWRTNGFIRGVVENQNLIFSRYGPEASARFTTLRVLALPVLVLSCLILAAYVRPMARFFEARGKPVLIVGSVLMAALLVASLTYGVFYLHDALGISNYMQPRRKPIGNADVALANFWFTMVAALPLVGLWLVASALAVVRIGLRMSMDRSEP